MQPIPFKRAGAALLAGCLMGSLPMTATARSAEKKVTINAQGAGIGDLLALIANQADINVVVDGSVADRKVTLRLTNVPLRRALRAIEQAYGLGEAEENGVIHIGSPEVLGREFPGGGGTTTRRFLIANADPTFVAQALNGTLPPGSVVMPEPRSGSVFVTGSAEAVAAAGRQIAQIDLPRVNPNGYASVGIPISNVKASDALAILKTELPPVGNQTEAASDVSNQIFVSGSTDFIATARGMLFDIDRPGKQVLFKIRVADINPVNDNSAIGALLGAPASASTSTSGTTAFNPGSVNYGFASKAVPIFATFQASQVQGSGTILAEPSVLAFNNKKSTIDIGEQYPITIFQPTTGENQVQFIQAGVNLSLTPIVGEDGSVTVDLEADYSQILSFVGAYPVVGQRQVTSSMRVDDGQTIVLAGLFEDVTSETVQRIPILGYLPFGLGTFFSNKVKNHTRDEIVFLISPHVFTKADEHDASALPRPATH